jgi:hypothetical protein
MLLCKMPSAADSLWHSKARTTRMRYLNMSACCQHVILASYLTGSQKWAKRCGASSCALLGQLNFGFGGCSRWKIANCLSAMVGVRPRDGIAVSISKSTLRGARHFCSLNVVSTRRTMLPNIHPHTHFSAIWEHLKRRCKYDWKRMGDRYSFLHSRYFDAATPVFTISLGIGDMG